MRLALGAALGCFLLMTAAARASMIVEDFNDSNDDGWIRYDPLGPFGAGGTFSFPDGAYRIQASASPFPAGLGPGRAGSGRVEITFSDFRAGVDLVTWDDTLEQGFGVVARVSQIGLGTTDGYWLHYSPISPTFDGKGSLILDRIDNEFPFILAEVPITLDPNQSYRLEFSGIGNMLSGRIFSLSDLHSPLATVMASDTTYTSGAVGLLVSDLIVGVNGPADATFDNFQVVAVPEPSALALFLPGTLAMLCYCRRQRQYSRYR